MDGLVSRHNIQIDIIQTCYTHIIISWYLLFIDFFSLVLFILTDIYILIAVKRLW